MKTLLRSIVTAITLLAMGGGLLAQQPSVRTGTLLQPIPVPVVINGKQVGNATLAKGLVVYVLREDGERVLVGNAMGSAWIPKAQIVLAAAPAPTVTAAPSVAPVASAVPSAPVIGRKPKVVLAGMGAYYDRAFVRDELRKAGYQVDEKYVKSDERLHPVSQLTGADIDAYDVFWFDGIYPFNALAPKLFQKLLKTRNKLVILSRTYDPISEIRKYGVVLEFPNPNPYSSVKSHNNHTTRGVNPNGDVNLVESEEGRLDVCDIITSMINSTAKDTTNPAIGQPTYAALAQRTLLPEVLKYMKRLEERLH